MAALEVFAVFEVKGLGMKAQAVAHTHHCVCDLVGRSRNGVVFLWRSDLPPFLLTLLFYSFSSFFFIELLLSLSFSSNHVGAFCPCLVQFFFSPSLSVSFLALFFQDVFVDIFEILFCSSILLRFELYFRYLVRYTDCTCGFKGFFFLFFFRFCFSFSLWLSVSSIQFRGVPCADTPKRLWGRGMEYPWDWQHGEGILVGAGAYSRMATYLPGPDKQVV
ncbi:hypothetical protein SODALDRAFT_173150 [Sodiomyces alkalinus F11]|uniref:Uncharacterized protein n=1 Tax=Sodiomyces alkalinus (strain CBS 110278 / VKM F-3762 / F11) TaxID=1314773 RepID=A0A3N2PWI3_SODAK|nr:hypothetical protein SODALDRAFT_173150 [Sodiomyces alkalinus F11]ROT38854.1 hypothetical protein SODALDRAFT_173150 [Sodiomyces alkalinus F11]